MINKVKYFEHNSLGRDFIVGDIHGCLTDFYALMKGIDFEHSRDRMFSVGDLVDRGPDSENCLNLMYNKWFFNVHSNHEDMMVQAIVNKDENSFNDWIYNGGSWYWSSDKEELKHHCNYIVENVPHVIVIGKDSDKRINIVHAELFSNYLTGEKTTDADIDTWNFFDFDHTNMIWGRKIAENRNLYSGLENPGLSTTYCGHTVVTEPFEVLNHRFIDTGAVYSYTRQLSTKLTCVDITNDVLYQYGIKDKSFTAEPFDKYFK